MDLYENYIIILSLILKREFKLREKIKDNLFSYTFALVMGAISTVFIFYITSDPSTSEEVKHEFISVTSKRLTENYKEHFSEVYADKFFSKELDIGSEKSIFVLGTAKSDGKIIRWISIFDKGPPSLIDKLVGRSGLFKLTSFTSFETPYENSLTFNKIESLDLNNDGIFEIHINLKSIWADSISMGPILYSKNIKGTWDLMVLPSISKTIKSNPKNIQMQGRSPYTYFGINGKKKPKSLSIKELQSLEILEESWSMNHNGETKELITLRNGGNYYFKEHPIKGYSQIQTLSFFNDEVDVLGPHYAVVNMFKFERNNLQVDELWNWEEPIYSSSPFRLSEIDMDSITKAGIQAHISGDVFWGYTEFEKIPPR